MVPALAPISVVEWLVAYHESLRSAFDHNAMYPDEAMNPQESLFGALRTHPRVGSPGWSNSTFDWRRDTKLAVLCSEHSAHDRSERRLPEIAPAKIHNPEPMES